MSYKAEELRPNKPVFVLNNKEIVFGLLTIEKEVQFIDKFGSLQKMYDLIKKEPQHIFDVCYELIENKNLFKNSLEVFKAEIYSIKTKLSLIDLSISFSNIFNDIIVKSMPLIKNKKRYDDIQKLKGFQNESDGSCYAVYFDAVAKRYGYTLDQFYQLTLRQLHIILKTINDKSYEELEVQAALQGKKLKPRIVFEDISEEQDKENEKQALEALEMLNKRYKEQQGKK